MKTAEKFWLDNYFGDSISDKDKKLWLECNNQAQITVSIMIEFAKLHVEAALKEASEKVVLESRLYSKYQGKIEKTENMGQEINLEDQLYLGIEKNSILNAYPESNIK